MEFDRLQFNARKAFFQIASDITILIEKKEDGLNSLEIIGGGRHTIGSDYSLHNDNLSDNEVETLVNSIESSLNYNDETAKG